MMASPGFIGMFACSSADAIMLVAPRLSAADSADRAALRRNVKREKNPPEDLVPESAEPSRPCTAAVEVDRPFPNKMMINRNTDIANASDASTTMSLPESDDAMSSDWA
jgi:hypothetical protein